MKISFEGLPGCRKHEIFLAINKRFGFTFISSFDSEWHQRFLSDPIKYGLAYELNRLMSFYHQSDLYLNFQTVDQQSINQDYKEYETLSDDSIMESDDKNNFDIDDIEDDEVDSEDNEDRNNEDRNNNDRNNDEDGNNDERINDNEIILDEDDIKKIDNEHNNRTTVTNTSIIKPKKVLYDSLYSIKKVYVEFMLYKKWMNKYEYDTFMKFYYLIYTPPDVIIYFYGTFENAFNRMKQMTYQTKKTDNQLIRYEYSEEEFKKLHYQYEWVFDNNNCRIPIFKINVDDDLTIILNNIEAVLKKIDEVFTY